MATGRTMTCPTLTNPPIWLDLFRRHGSSRGGGLSLPHMDAACGRCRGPWRPFSWRALPTYRIALSELNLAPLRRATSLAYARIMRARARLPPYRGVGTQHTQQHATNTTAPPGKRGITRALPLPGAVLLRAQQNDIKHLVIFLSLLVACVAWFCCVQHIKRSTAFCQAFGNQLIEDALGG